jgi:hypothetical protein
VKRVKFVSNFVADGGRSATAPVRRDGNFGSEERAAPMGEEKKKRRTKAAESGAAKRSGKKQGRNKTELISRVIANIESKLISEELKPSVGDFIRLLQLEKELDEEQPKEIKVSWVEAEEQSEPENVSVK